MSAFIASVVRAVMFDDSYHEKKACADSFRLSSIEVWFSLDK